MLSLVYIKLPQMNVCAKYFDKNSKHVDFLVSDDKIFKKNTMKFGTKLKIYLKNKLIVNQCIMTNT